MLGPPSIRWPIVSEEGRFVSRGYSPVSFAHRVAQRLLEGEAPSLPLTMRV